MIVCSECHLDEYLNGKQCTYCSQMFVYDAVDVL